MARFENDPFPGTDYSKYLEWPKVVLPSGEVYYEVPGHSGYVFDPVASNASGRKVFRQNPRGQIDKQQEEEDRIRKLQDQQSFNQSPQGQLIPVALGTGGLIAASKFGGLGAAANPLATIGAGSAATPAGAAATGALGTGVAPTAAVAPVTTVAPTTVGAAPSAVAAAPEAAGVVANPALASLAPVGLGAIAAYTAYKGYKGYEAGEGKGFLGGAKAGFDAAGPLKFVPILGQAPIIAGAFGGMFGQPSTRDIAKKHTKDLLSQGKDDANYQAYVQGMREQYNSAPKDPSKPFAGKYSSWDEYVKGGLEAADLTGVYGNIKTYGPEWANLTQEQRQAITQANIDSGIYKSKKGEVEITDQAKAIENKNNVLKGFQVGAQATTPSPVVPPVVTPPMTPAQAASRGAVESAMKKALR